MFLVSAAFMKIALFEGADIGFVYEPAAPDAQDKKNSIPCLTPYSECLLFYKFKILI